MGKIPEEWLSRVKMNRVICHWTAGEHQASDLDKAHYHLLVEADGNVVRGKYSIAANSSIRRERGYAAHTRQANTKSIGITCCAMLNAMERPFDPGAFPLTETQWNVMAEAVAELCGFYEIPVLPHTVLGHGEVERNLGVMQHGKWDPLALPWKPELSLKEAGDLFREKVKSLLEPPAEETEATFELKAIVIRDHEFTDAIMENGSAFVAAAPVAEAFDLVVTHDARSHDLDVKLADGRNFDVPYTVFDAQRYADTAELARIFDLERTWDARKKIVTLA